MRASGGHEEKRDFGAESIIEMIQTRPSSPSHTHAREEAQGALKDIQEARKITAGKAFSYSKKLFMP